MLGDKLGLGSLTFLTPPLPLPWSPAMIWGAAKAKIRAAPRAQTMLELKKRIIKVLLWVCACRLSSAECARLFTPSP